MRGIRAVAAALAWSALGAAAPGAAALGADLQPIQPGLDYHSFANVEQFRVTHLALDLHVDFAAQVLRGAVGLEIERLDPRATQLVLDTCDLNISDVSQKATDVLGATAPAQELWVSRPFHFDKPDPILGSALVIELPASRRAVEFIKIEYETTPAAPALQWLSAGQTAGKRKPFLYTQAAPIGTRSWIPLQDSPQVRLTYTATIHTPSGLLAVMSARNDAKVKRNGEYAFVMPEPIPSYSIALAVGDLGFKPTGTRTGVYAERPRLGAAAKEFADTEAMIEAGEKLFGPYRWDRYDILVMPPSFPVGGMENPRLSFVTPTLIAGDRSLVSGIAHELAHSWSGNLVGNATWRDLWLNEGFADYLESRIMTEVYGERRAAMQALLGLGALRDALATLAPADQMLAIDLRNRDPELACSAVAHEKGRLFLSFLEAKFGRERFDAWLRGYFDHFAFKSISSEQFLAYLQENLLDRFPGILTHAEAADWLMGPGIPAAAPLPASGALDEVDAARSLWLASGLAAEQLATQAWVSEQWLYFLDKMPARLDAQRMAQLDQAFGFTRSRNAPIASSWFNLAIRNGYTPSFPRLEEYLKTVGRRTLIAPLYAELVKTPAGAAWAQRVYGLARPTYHPQTVAAIDAVLGTDR